MEIKFVIGIIRIISFITILVGVSGCVSSIRVNSLKDIKENEKLVFGKISVVHTKKITLNVSTLYLKKDTSTEIISYRVKNGKIYWHLLPGKYVVTGWNLNSGGYGRIWWKFSVPTSGGGLYIGDISVNLDSRDLVVSVEDNEKLVTENIIRRFPKFKGKIYKSILHREEI